MATLFVVRCYLCSVVDYNVPDAFFAGAFCFADIRMVKQIPEKMCAQGMYGIHGRNEKFCIHILTFIESHVY